MKTLIQGGTLIYACAAKKEDILIENGMIREIQSAIRPRGDEQVIDGSAYYIMPGFISTTEEESGSGLEYGVTTEVRRITDSLKEMERMQGVLDFVCQVSLPCLTKESLRLLDEKRVKVLETDWIGVDWELWQPRLYRAGIVLSVKEEDFLALQHIPLPMVIPYGKWKKTKRARTVLQVRGGCEQAWNKHSDSLDPYVIPSYWVDQAPFPLQRMNKGNSLEKSLIMTANTRSRIPARLYGIYPRKGSLHPGADADLLLADKNRLLKGDEKPFIPDRIMVKGKWVNEVKNKGEGLAGGILRGNQTYAFYF